MNHFLRRILSGTLFLLLGVPGSAQPAPKLTSMSVISVQSDKGGLEIIDPGQMSTDNGHAGTRLVFWIKEIGYGSSQIAQLNGVTLTTGSVTTITDSSNIVIGFNRQFIYSGAYVSGGKFFYQNISTNYPWNTMNVGLYILPYYAPPSFSTYNTQFFSSDYTSDPRNNPPTEASYQFQANDPAGDTITYSLENATGGSLTNNVNITPNGWFTWDGRYTSMFTRSTSCPYPYFAQIKVVAKNSHGSTAKLLVTLQVLYGPLPQCVAPPPAPDN